MAKKPTAKPKTRRPALLADDVSHMTTLMALHGVTGSPADLFHALVVAAAEQHQRQAQSIYELNTNLTWFTHRIDDLEQTRHQLQQERDLLRHNPPSSEMPNQLTAENQRLMMELLQTQQQLSAIQHLLNGSLAGTLPAVDPGEQAGAGVTGFLALEGEAGAADEPRASREANAVFELRSALHPK